MMNIVCINLAKRIDRLDQFSAFMHREGLRFQRFEAVEGYEVPGMLTGNVGCCESHRRILSSITEPTLVFEDDTELIEGFVDGFESALLDLPSNWDIFYLGGNNVAHPIRVTDRICRCVRTYTTNAYFIRPEAAHRLASMISSPPSEPIDLTFCRLQQEGNCYVANPPLAWQKAGWSDIQNMHMDVENRMKEIY